MMTLSYSIRRPGGIVRQIAVVLACVWITAMASAGPAQAAEPYTMKLTTTGMDDPQHAFLREFKRRLDERTEGRITTKIYPAGQLGSIPRLIEGMQLGTIESYTVPPEFLSGVDPRFQVVAAPGVFDDIAHAARSLSDPKFRDRYLSLGERHGIKGLSIWVYGPIFIASVDPIRTLNDFKGKKIRVMATDIETTLMGEFGAAGIPIPMGDVLPALQTRQIDSIRTSLVVMNANKHWTVAPYATVTREAQNICAMFVSMKFWNRLPTELQKTIEEVAKGMEAYMLEKAQEFDRGVIDAWESNGGQIIRLPAEEHAEYIRRASAIADKVIGEDPDMRKMYELLIDATERNR